MSPVMTITGGLRSRRAISSRTCAVCDPAAHRRRNCVEIGLEPVIAAHRHHLAQRTGRRDPVRIARALDDERRHGDRIELGETALPRLTGTGRRRERERKTEDTGGACCIRRPARDTRAERASADHERKVRELGAAQPFDDDGPGCVELSGRRRRASPGDPVRLLDERDRHADRESGLSRSDEIRRADASSCAVSEHERTVWVFAHVQVDARRTMRSVDVDRARVAHMRYLVIETYVGGADAVYARAGRQGRMLPAGLAYIDSWVDERTLDRCFQLMETDDPNAFDEWTARWSDLVEFEIVPVISSSEAARRAQ